MTSPPAKAAKLKRGVWARASLGIRALTAGIIAAAIAAGALASVGLTVLSKDEGPIDSKALLTAAGIGAVAGLPAAVLAGLFLSRLRALLAIAEALRTHALQGGIGSVLRVRESGDVESAAWNALVQATAEAASERPVEAPTLAADLTPVCDALWFGVVRLAPTGEIRYANGAALAALNADPDTALGRPILTADVPTGLAPLLDAPSFKRGTFDQEDEQTALRYTVRPIREHDGGGALIVIEDTTQRRAAEKARQDFVAHATHELRAPLTNIKLYIEDASDELATDADRRNALAIINEQADRLDRIVADLLDISEIEAASFSIAHGEVRTSTIVDEIKSGNEPTARAANVKLSFDLAPRLPVLKGDRRKVFIAMNNLVGNAIKYTPEGGSVTVRASAVDGYFHFEVEDDGFGISPEDLAKIFDKFERAADPRVASLTGTGLGLPLSREVARRHGGDITVTSQIDQGSIFTLTLPLPDQESAVAEAA